MSRSSGSGEADAVAEQIAAAGGFIKIECCGESVGFTNPRPFTREASARFDAIRRRHVTTADPFGNGWVDDPEAKALLADPASHGSPDDGERLPFTCPACGASFVWVGGQPHRIGKEIA